MSSLLYLSAWSGLSSCLVWSVRRVCLFDLSVNLVWSGLSAYLPACLVCLSICLLYLSAWSGLSVGFVYLICLSIWSGLSVYLPACLVCLSICLSDPSVYLPV
ncbi:hypothetical protein CEXT_546531 [Caerostris extrusa]|uniref:NADH dehydrogenase subunit 6 n=1 Tax=Caerostris extrusa TaxID=172846 RepID=A0AAV4QNE4_CAEEX|nr:hypothetical protein CEXT_546531 [Caerostris extrusa]